MTSVVVTLPLFSSYIKTESDAFLKAQNDDFLITEGQPGVQAFTYVGNVTAIGGAGASVSGVQGTFSVGTVTVLAQADISVTGVQAVGQIGNVLVWGLVNTSQTPNWTQILN
jgi:hypothetical protein